MEIELYLSKISGLDMKMCLYIFQRLAVSIDKLIQHNIANNHIPRKYSKNIDRKDTSKKNDNITRADPRKCGALVKNLITYSISSVVTFLNCTYVIREKEVIRIINQNGKKRIASIDTRKGIRKATEITKLKICTI
jgi:hypothetical protein